MKRKKAAPGLDTGNGRGRKAFGALFLSLYGITPAIFWQDRR